MRNLQNRTTKFVISFILTRLFSEWSTRDVRRVALDQDESNQKRKATLNGNNGKSLEDCF